MLTPPERIIDFEPEEPFNRADCVRYTARTFILSPSPLVGQEIGTRYLAYDVYVMPMELFVERSHSLDLDVAQRVTQFGDPGVELTDEKLREFGEQEKQARRSFGPAVVEHAGRFGLVETLTPEQAKACLALAPHVNLVGLIDQQYSDFSLSGWDVFPSEDDNKPVLLVPTKSEEGQASFDIVRLDDLYGRDPEFLRQQIIEYEEKYAMDSLASSVTCNLNLHQVSKEELIPEYMREVAQIADPEQRATEVRSMQAFLNRMVKLGYGYQGAVYGFNQELSRIRPLGNGYSYDIQSYLGHMARCPTQTEEAGQRSINLIKVYNDFLSVDYNVAPFDRQTDDPVIRVLQEPARYIPVYLDQAEEERVADREQDQKVIGFIAKTRGITDQTQLLEALQQELPEFHGTLVRFQEWLGVDYFNKSNFDELILRSADAISIDDEKFDLKQVHKTIIEKLALERFSVKGEFEGVYIDTQTSYLINPHLEAILPLLVIKSAQSKAEEKKGDRIMADRYERKVQHCQRLTDSLGQSYEEKSKRADENIRKVRKYREDIAKFKSQIGITDEEIANLIELTKKEDRDDDFGPEIDSYLYTGLFNALVLSKQGIVDMQSPAFKALLKSLFRDSPATLWKNP